jgi:hypothetical protein
LTSISSCARAEPANNPTNTAASTDDDLMSLMILSPSSWIADAVMWGKRSATVQRAFCQ